MHNDLYGDSMTIISSNHRVSNSTHSFHPSGNTLQTAQGLFLKLDDSWRWVLRSDAR